MGQAKISQDEPNLYCSFYKQPDTAPKHSNGFQLDHAPPLNIIIVGDFNLPSIAWSDAGAFEGALIMPSPAYGKELNNLVLELMDDYGLEQ